MSDRTRRFLCRTTFILFCFLPTLVVANWALFPRTTAEWTAALQPQLGVLLRIERASTRTPFKTVFEQIQIADRYRRLLATIPRATWLHEPASHAVTLEPFEIALGAWTRSCRHLIDAAMGATVDLAIEIPALTIHDEQNDRKMTLHNCRIEIHPNPAGARVRAVFQVDQRASPLLWSYQVRFESDGMAREWTLDTQQNKVPCWLLVGEAPLLRYLGAGATFCGQITGSGLAQNFTVDVSSMVLESVDLQSAFAELGNVGIDGQAQIALSAAQLIDGRIASLDAALECPSGRIDTTFLASLGKWLRLQHAELPDGVVEFEQLAVAVEIRDGRVSIRNPRERGAIMLSARSHQAIAAASSESLALPVHVLACCLADGEAYAVPADPRALNVLPYLPATR